MKFRTRLALAILTLLGPLLALNGALLIWRNFCDARDTLWQSSVQQHRQDALQLELQMLTLQSGTGGVEYNDLYRFGRQQHAADRDREFALVGENRLTLFSCLPNGLNYEKRAQALEQEGMAQLVRCGEKWYLLACSAVDFPGREVYLLSAYDFTGLYQSRRRQLDILTQTTCLTLAVAVGAALLLARGMTRPLSRLEKASAAIAGGEYHQRTDIRTGDEIAGVSASFDRMAEAIEEKVHQLEESVRRREDFVGAFTHEIKTPMAVIQGYASRLSASPRPAQETAEYAEQIYREARRLNTLSETLLELCALREDKPQMGPVRLDALMKTVRDAFARSGEVIGLQAGKPVAVWGNGILLEDLLRNLCRNALRACRDGGTVAMGWQAENERAVLFVKDTGCGMPESELARITEAFYMVDKARARAENGSGLGLALCEKIAALHGAVLEFESEVGRGTVVRMALPVCGKVEYRDENV